MGEAASNIYKEGGLGGFLYVRYLFVACLLLYIVNGLCVVRNICIIISHCAQQYDTNTECMLLMALVWFVVAV